MRDLHRQRQQTSSHQQYSNVGKRHCRTTSHVKCSQHNKLLPEPTNHLKPQKHEPPTTIKQPTLPQPTRQPTTQLYTRKNRHPTRHTRGSSFLHTQRLQRQNKPSNTKVSNTNQLHNPRNKRPPTLHSPQPYMRRNPPTTTTTQKRPTTQPRTRPHLKNIQSKWSMSRPQLNLRPRNERPPRLCSTKGQHICLRKTKQKNMPQVSHVVSRHMKTKRTQPYAYP